MANRIMVTGFQNAYRAVVPFVVFKAKETLNGPRIRLLKPKVMFHTTAAWPIHIQQMYFSSCLFLFCQLVHWTLVVAIASVKYTFDSTSFVGWMCMCVRVFYRMTIFTHSHRFTLRKEKSVLRRLFRLKYSRLRLKEINYDYVWRPWVIG